MESNSQSDPQPAISHGEQVRRGWIAAIHTGLIIVNVGLSAAVSTQGEFGGLAITATLGVISFSRLLAQYKYLDGAPEPEQDAPIHQKTDGLTYMSRPRDPYAGVSGTDPHAWEEGKRKYPDDAKDEGQ